VVGDVAARVAASRQARKRRFRRGQTISQGTPGRQNSLIASSARMAALAIAWERSQPRAHRPALEIKSTAIAAAAAAMYQAAHHAARGDAP
jgi:hypothetical protein